MFADMSPKSLIFNHTSCIISVVKKENREKRKKVNSSGAWAGSGCRKFFDFSYQTQIYLLNQFVEFAGTLCFDFNCQTKISLLNQFVEFLFML